MTLSRIDFLSRCNLRFLCYCVTSVT